MLANANRALEQAPGERAGGRRGGGERAGGGDDLLCLAYRMTGERKFGERVKQILLAQPLGGRSDAELLRRDPPWHSSLGSGAACAAFGVAFDSVYDLLSPAERTAVAARLATEGILPVLDDWVLGGKRIHSLDTMGHNWWSAIVFGAGIGAMAILDEEPRARLGRARGSRRGRVDALRRQPHREQAGELRRQRRLLRERQLRGLRHQQ
jgi:oligo-alginate lyase